MDCAVLYTKGVVEISLRPPDELFVEGTSIMRELVHTRAEHVRRPLATLSWGAKTWQKLRICNQLKL